MTFKMPKVSQTNLSLRENIEQYMITANNRNKKKIFRSHSTLLALP